MPILLSLSLSLFLFADDLLSPGAAGTAGDPFFTTFFDGLRRTATTARHASSASA